ncbi:hypothetical protein TcasGA2_TC011493 [Tribolium castaneum]|uniref:Uncharacterized protein n=1 Tax=Tribolium castaneum TaxID=7070 RepID=D7EK74_TRICA|nr:hypothetical protein TcasGA2_TC011493 [Tribolium castaneum]
MPPKKTAASPEKETPTTKAPETLSHSQYSSALRGDESTDTEILATTRIPRGDEIKPRISAEGGEESRPVKPVLETSPEKSTRNQEGYDIHDDSRQCDNSDCLCNREKDIEEIPF